MATRLQQVITFPALAPGASLALPIDLNWNGRAVIPDLIYPEYTNAEFTVTACTETLMTVRNDDAGVQSFTFWLMSVWSEGRAFGDSATQFLAPLPFVVGGGGSGGGGGGGGALQSFRYTVTGLEPDLSDFFVTLPAARATDIYRVTSTIAGAVGIIPFDCPDTLVGDRTTTQFRVVASSAFTAGDQIDFHVFDQVP